MRFNYRLMTYPFPDRFTPSDIQYKYMSYLRKLSHGDEKKAADKCRIGLFRDCKVISILRFIVDIGIFNV
mgnify:CR=1 FL=1